MSNKKKRTLNEMQTDLQNLKREIEESDLSLTVLWNDKDDVPNSVSLRPADRIFVGEKSR